MRFKTRFASKAKSSLMVAVLALVTSGSILAIGAQRSYADSTTPPPWDTFSPTDGTTYGGNTSPAGYGSNGGLLFYNSAGQQITGGSITTAPFAAYIEGAASTGGTPPENVQISLALPTGSDPSGWTTSGLGNTATRFPNSGAPSNLQSSSLPVFTGGSSEATLSSFVTEYPDGGNPDAGYYQVRLYTNNQSVFDSADIDIDTSNNTWTLAYSNDEFAGGTASTPSAVGTATTVSSVTTSPVVAGNPVDLSASVTDDDGSSPDGGTVQFYEKIGSATAAAIGSPVTVSGGTATFDYTTSAADEGSDNYTAQFTPAAGTNYSTSTSATPVSLNVTAPLTATSTALAASPTSPQPFDTSETLTATITPSVATGTVQFEDAGSNIGGAVTVSGGQAQYMTSALPVGTDDLSAVFTPTNGNGYSGSTGVLDFTVSGISTSTALAASPTSPQPFDTSETLTATITPSGATGTVQFKDAGANIGSAVTVSGGQAQYMTSALPVGTDDLSAVFTPTNGNGYAGSTGTASFVVVPVPPAAPPGATSSQGATSTTPTGTATATESEATVSATGTGSLTVSTYASNPSGIAISDGTGAYYDASVASGSTFASLTITICDPGSGNSLQWFNGTSWLNFSNVTTSNGCLVATVTSSTSPTLGQLTGTPIAVITEGTGYTLAASDGGVFNFGTTYYGSEGGKPLDKPVVGMASTPSGNGYWLVASDGGVFNFGDAGFYGSEGGKPLAKPIVGIASTPSGNGYWLVASDGGVFAFGDAGFYGSEGGKPLDKPVVGMASTPSGNGYWLVASDGGVFNFGDAGFYGSEGGKPLDRPVVGMASSPTGNGYWLVASDGGVFNFGGALFYGSEGGKPLDRPVVGISSAPSGTGYWLFASDGGVFNFGNATFQGSAGGLKLSAPVVAGTGA